MQSTVTKQTPNSQRERKPTCEHARYVLPLINLIYSTVCSRVDHLCPGLINKRFIVYIV